MKNKQTFAIKLTSQKLFSLFISGIGQIISWVENIGLQLVFTANMVLRIYATANIALVASVVAALSALQSNTSAITIALELNVAKWSEKRYIRSDITIPFLFNVAYAKAKYRIMSFIDSVITITATATIAQFIALGIHDTILLGVLDPQELGVLDSVIIAP